MAIVVPSAESVNSLPFPLTEKQRIVAQTLLEILESQPRSRILLWATVFILQAIGIPQTVVAAWFGCSTRNLRHINQKVRSIRRGDGKTGRPPKPKEQPAQERPPVIGYSAYAGLWLLLPLLLESHLLEFARLLPFLVPIAGLAPWQWVLTVMVLAWLGFSHPHHLRDLWDVGVALFTGRRTVLDADRARKGLKAIPRKATERFYRATARAEWDEISTPLRGRRPHPWVSVDEHTVGHQGGPQMPKAKVPRFGRVRMAHHLFGTFVLGVRRFVGLVVTRANKRLCHVAPGQLAEARTHQAQAQPSGLEPHGVSDPVGARPLGPWPSRAKPQARGIRAILDRGSHQAQAHQALQALKEQGVTYLALARRTRRLVAYWDGLVCNGLLELHPYIHHHDLCLPPEERRDHFFLAVCQTPLEVKEEGGKKETIWVPTILIIDETKLFDEDPKARYVAVFFGNLDLPPGLWGQAYPTRQEQELAHRDLIHALGFDALPKGYQKVHPEKALSDPQQETVLDTKDIFLTSWLRMLAYNRVTQFLERLPQAYRRLTVVTAARKFLRRPGLLLLERDYLVVRLDPFPDSRALTEYLAWVNEQQLAIPWLSGLRLRIEVGHKPAAQTLPPTQWRKLLSAPT